MPAGAAVAAGAAAAGSIRAFPSSPSRWLIERKPISSSQVASLGGSGSAMPRSLIGSGSGASSRRMTSWREMRAACACAISASRRLDGFIAGAAARMLSRSPYSATRALAFLGPMPGTPGTLSTASPISAWTSTTLSGPTPKRACTSASPIGFCLIGSIMPTLGRINCIRSLSEETMVQRPPASSMQRA